MKPMTTARQALTILADRATRKAKIHTAAQGFHARTLRDLKGRHWDDALAIATDDPTQSPEQIANLLDPGSAIAPAPSEPQRPELETFEPEAWTPLDEDGREWARRRIDDIRAGLNNGSAA